MEEFCIRFSKKRNKLLHEVVIFSSLLVFICSKISIAVALEWILNLRINWPKQSL